MAVNIYKHEYSCDQDLQGSTVRWSMFLQLQFPMLHMSQKLWKLGCSRQSYSKI